MTVAKVSKNNVVLTVIGLLGTVPKHLEHHLNISDIDKITISQFHKAALLGAAYIL